MMGTTSSHHAVHAPVSERHVCRFMLLSSPFESACFWVLLSLANLALLTPLLRQSRFPSSSDIPSRSSSTPYNFCFFTPSCFSVMSLHLCTMLPALQACRKRLDHSLSLPAENWTCFIEANPHVHRAHTVAHVQLDHCSIPNVSDVRVLFIQHNSVSGSDDLLNWNEGFDNICTSEDYAPLDSLVCLERDSICDCSPCSTVTLGWPSSPFSCSAW